MITILKHSSKHFSFTADTFIPISTKKSCKFDYSNLSTSSSATLLKTALKLLLL